MTNEVTRVDDSPWGIASVAHSPTEGPHARTGPAASDLSFSTLLRILFEWRWLILSLVAVGVAGATVITLLTTPLYRSEATLEANPPSVEIMGEKTGAQAQTQDSWTFITTQVGLLNSRSLARRVAQDLNLATNPEVVDPKLDAPTRLKVATS